MKKLLLAITVALLSNYAIAQSWTWSNSVGGRSSVDGGTGLTRDGAGNFYVCGDFEGTRAFGSTTLTAVALSDFYLTKFDPNGAIQWTIQINGTAANTMETAGVTTDAAGNVYVAGNFSYDVTFGSNTYFNLGGNSDAFIAKYSSAGNLIWSKHLSGTGTEKLYSISALGTDIYISGAYTQALTVGSVSLAAPGAGFDDAFIMKFDSSSTALWGLRGGGNAEDRGTSLSVSNNAIYWAGYFSGSANFNGTTLAAIGTGSDMFLVRLTDTGTQTWAKRYGGNFGQQINGVSQDAQGNPVCTGNFYATSTFGTGMVLVEAYGMAPAGNGDAFIAKFNNVDGTCLWVRQIKCTNGDNNEVSYGISTDPGGSSYITGGFNGNTLFSTSTTQSTGTTLTATNGKDAFLAKYDINGNLLWVQKIGGNSNDIGKAVKWDTNGDVNVAGNFGGTITLGSTSVTASPGSASVFLARYDGLTTGLSAIDNSFQFEMYPNPADEFVNLVIPSTEKVQSIQLMDLSGKAVKQFGFNASGNNIQLDVTEIPAGFYLLQINSDKGLGVRKLQID